MLLQPFNIKPHNAHYEGSYDDAMLDWRRVNAREKAANLVRLVGDRKFGSVLEVGCGTGAVLGELARQGVGTRHVGVDMADPAEHRDADTSGLELSAYDGDRLPFPDGSFDLVFASHVLEHVPHERLFLAELARVAKHLIYVEVPCESHARTTQPAMQVSLNIGHINAYSPESFLLKLQTSGLRVIELEVFDHIREVYDFFGTGVKSTAKRLLKSSMHKVSPRLAARMMTYHVGALCTASGEA